MGRPRSFDADVVLDRAVETFRARGFDGTSVEDLEKATGLRRASLYGAYGDKRALYLAALRRYDGTRAVRMLERLNGEKTGRAALERLFAIVIGEASADPGGCLIGNAATERASHDDGVARCVADNRRRIEGGLTAAVLRGRADRSLRGAGDARETGRFLFAAVLGIRALAKSGSSRAELSGVARRALAAAGG
ncbi:MAG: TetR/AcrR family transcriptional regulator [Elusimicrobia bacterium]|nr:TetR/AcrR family transcriptional regulator [Elusimicrobiota bacterium]